MSQELLGQIDRLIRQRPMAKEALTSFRGLAVLMEENDLEAKGFELEDRLKKVKQEEGFPLFQREDLPLDLESASELFKRFLEYLGKTDRKDRQGVIRVMKRTQAEPEWPERLLKAILRQDEKAFSRITAEIDLEPRVLLFLGGVALRPSLQALRRKVSDTIAKDKWEFGYCPLCGSQPDMAFLERTGKRYLHCELCGEEWPYLRIRCPFCNNDDPETLGYFQAEGEEGFRVDFCKKCQRYVKTIDKRVIEEVAPLELENLATIHLDVLANQNGFK